MVKEFDLKEETQKLENRELKKYLKYYGLNDMSEMSEVQLEEFCNYFSDIKFKFYLKCMKMLADGKLIILGKKEAK